MSKNQSTLAQRAQELHDNPMDLQKDEQVIKEITGKDVWQGFLSKKVKIPKILQAHNLGRTEMTNMEVILGRAELYLTDPDTDLSSFQKILNLIFDKAFLNEEKKAPENIEQKTLAEYPQEILLDSVIQVIKYLDVERLETALNAITCQLMIKRSGEARIINN